VSRKRVTWAAASVGVSGRVRALGAHELAQELDDHLAIVVEPLRELTLHVVHDTTPGSGWESIHQGMRPPGRVV
jgi:hypothetical protein